MQFLFTQTIRPRGFGHNIPNNGQSTESSRGGYHCRCIRDPGKFWCSTGVANPGRPCHVSSLSRFCVALDERTFGMITPTSCVCYMPPLPVLPIVMLRYIVASFLFALLCSAHNIQSHAGQWFPSAADGRVEPGPAQRCPAPIVAIVRADRDFTTSREAQEQTSRKCRFANNHVTVVSYYYKRRGIRCCSHHVRDRRTHGNRRP